MYDESTIGCLFCMFILAVLVVASVTIGIFFGIWWGVVAFAAFVAILALLLIIYVMRRNREV